MRLPRFPEFIHVVQIHGSTPKSEIPCR
ncbi:hypothetical protein AYI68_g4968, partial [Smittium mucronatum]